MIDRNGIVAADAAIEILMQNTPETLDQMLARMRRVLAAAGVENPALDARLMMRQGGNFTDSDMISGGQTPLSVQIIENVEKLLTRRLAGEPVSRLAGGREFWGLYFIVTPDTLDPRPDTETLVENALKTIPNIAPAEEAGLAAMASMHADTGLRILDLGTGSGCILISLLKELPHARGLGIDLNPGAVAVARRNAAANGVADRVEFRAGSWFEPLEDGESFDLIVSNPPYIPEGDIESLAPEVRNHDPKLALTGGADGLDAYKIILKKLKKYLSCGGRALFEIGKGQEVDLARLVDDSNMSVCDSYRDLAGVIRVVEVGHGEK
jgi:release factor glutamine methyltransferase